MRFYYIIKMTKLSDLMENIEEETRPNNDGARRTCMPPQNYYMDLNGMEAHVVATTTGKWESEKQHKYSYMLIMLWLQRAPIHGVSP